MLSCIDIVHMYTVKSFISVVHVYQASIYRPSSHHVPLWNRRGVH